MGGVTVTEFVPLAGVMEYPLVVQPLRAARFAFCCNV